MIKNVQAKNQEWADTNKEDGRRRPTKRLFLYAVWHTTHADVSTIDTPLLLLTNSVSEQVREINFSLLLLSGKKSPILNKDVDFWYISCPWLNCGFQTAWYPCKAQSQTKCWWAGLFLPTQRGFRSVRMPLLTSPVTSHIQLIVCVTSDAD